MIAPLPALTATKPGSATRPLPGITAKLLNTDGNEVTDGTGILVITEPWPAMLRTLYGDDERYADTYFGRFGPHTYVVGDYARRDSDGYIWVIGRMDDVINVSGHRLSTAEIESALVSHPAVAEAAVVASDDELTGHAIVAFVSLRADIDETGLDELLREHVAERIGKLARPKRIIFTAELPKTRSGKLMRRLLRDLTDGRELGDVSTLADATVLANLQQRVAGI
jgi:acetyl-CoA synthetase